VPGIKENYLLSDHNSLQLAARCRAYCKATDINDIQRAIEYAAQHGFKILPLGDGSNVVLGDLDDTLVIDVALKGIELLEDTGEAVRLKIMAGENWHQFVTYCLEHGYCGLENLALIPGRVGAAPVQNIGAYGVELSQFFEKVEGVAIATPAQLTSLSAAQCQLAYRDSIFKRALRDKYIITSVYLKLSKKFVPQLQYKALSAHVDDTLGCEAASVTARQVFAAVVAIREQKLPDPKQVPNAGSFFKNPVVSHELFQQLIRQYPEIPYHALPKNNLNTPGYKIAAAWLIEQCGFKGVEYKGLAMHRHQALVLTRVDSPSQRKEINASHVIEFAKQVQAAVQARFAITLEVEPRCYL